MTQPLSWNLHGNDQLSGVLEKLDRVLDKVSRHLDKTSADAKRMGQALGEAEVKTQKFGAQTATAGGHLDGFSAKAATAVGTLGRFAAGATAALVLATGAAGVFGLKSAMAMETSKVSFEQMLGSADKAKRFLGDLAAFAEKTPFQLQDLQTYSSRLLAVGVNARDIIPLLRRIGEATAAVGTGAFGIELATNALNQMKLASNVNLIDLRQLANAGVPIFDALAAHLHTTTAKILEMVSAGKIGVDDVFTAIETGAGEKLGALNGIMDKQSATLEGKLSNFKDKAQRVLGEAFEPALPALSKLTDDVSNAIPKVVGKLQSMGGQVADIFKGSDVPSKFTASLKDLGEKILPVLKDAWDGIVGTIRDNKDGLEKLGRFVTDFVIPAFGDGLVVSIRMVAGAFEGIIWVAARVVDAVNFLWVGFRSMLEMVLTQAEIAFGWIPGLGPKLKKAKQDFDTWADGITNKLNALDGRTVYIGVGFKAAERNATLGSVTNTNLNGRASGGPTWAGQVYTWNEHGTERFYSNTSGRIESARPGGGSQSGGDGEVIGVLKVVHVTPDGKVMHEELLTLKRGKGGKALGLG